MNSTEKKIEKMKQDFILALKDVSKSVELNSERTEAGHFKLLSKEEVKLISKLRKRMKRADEIANALKAIDKFKDLHYLLEDSDPIIVTYYCKFNYPNYADEFIPILRKLYEECPKDMGLYRVEIGEALQEFKKLLKT